MNANPSMRINSLDQTFGALADSTRRAILMRLAQGDATVGELARPFAISLPAVSRHLKVLEEASLIFNERQGKHRLCRLNREALANAHDWLDFSRRFWIGSLDRLDTHLATRKPKQERKS
jgi:DNA-binding transcriptional ArsR family regulator